MAASALHPASLGVTSQRRAGRACPSVARAVRIAAVLGVCLYAAHSLFDLGGSGSDNLFENWIFNALLFAGAALCLLRAAFSSVERAAWLVMGTGLFCWAVGEVIFTLDPSEITEGSFPALSDYLWLVFYPAAFLTLGLLVRARVREFYPSLWLDGLLGALAVGALACQFVLPPIVAGTGGSLSSVVGDLVYPLGDVVLMSFAVGVLAVTAWRPGRVLGAVALALALGSVADVASLYSSAGGGDGSTVFESLWPASAVALGWAAWQPVRPSAVIGLHGRRLLVFPLCFAAVALGLLTIRIAGPLHGGTYVLALMALAGAIVRMGLTFSENVGLVERSRKEALTDPLTGLDNRRSLLRGLEDVLQSASERVPYVLVIFDLNGFKTYNDSFGHPAGDALLARLGAKLAAAVAPEGKAYRLGGDEFCLLAPLTRRSPDDIAFAAVDALSERGEAFDITTAYGYVTVPAEAQDCSAALRLADERLYSNKRYRRSLDAPDQLRDVLLQVMAEREPDLPDHVHEVAALAQAVGRAMGLTGEDLEVVVRGAELHDVGKIAVPEAILRKPGPLDPIERAIIERHSEIGERILSAAPAMAPVARLVRASHERYDGRGYPDHRPGSEIPLGARIIAVCDSYHAMRSDRPYGAGISAQEAIAELRRCAGSQFDPRVVEAFCEQFDTSASPGLASPIASERAA
jgi:diguanylate cyclase (GGDEF)-like protein